MEQKQTIIKPIHTEDNRLARRLFQLEQRVDELERLAEDLSEKIDFLAAVEMFREEGEEGFRFCTCDEDES